MEEGQFFISFCGPVYSYMGPIMLGMLHPSLVVQRWAVGVCAALIASDASAILLLAPLSGCVSGLVPLPLAELGY